MQEPPEHFRYQVLGKSSLIHAPHPVWRGVFDSRGLNTFDIRPPAISLEVEDQSFHHNSAVMLPALKSDLLPQEPVSAGEANLLSELKPFYPEWYEAFKNWYIPEEKLKRFEYHRRAFAILAICYLFLEQYPRYRLLLAGHTDTSGGEAYNFALSDLRAENVNCLLRGDRERWVAIAAEKGKVEDIQLICSYLNHIHGWPCDPGPLDDEMGPLTGAAIEGLQKTYNETFGKCIAVDGEAGTETWGAIYDIYMRELAGMLDTDVEHLPQYRASLRYVDDNYHRIGCGERIPIDDAGRENYRSVENRRVELLFFDENYLPDLSAHLQGGKIRSSSCGREASGIYAPGAYHFLHLSPRWWASGALPLSGTDEPHPRVETIEESLDNLPVPPNCPDHGLALYDPTKEEAIESGIFLEVPDMDESDND
jgi:hypothetical protein